MLSCSVCGEELKDEMSSLNGYCKLCTNYCVECGVDMGPCNPRQLCGKTVCLGYGSKITETSDSTEVSTEDLEELVAQVALRVLVDIVLSKKEEIKKITKHHVNTWKRNAGLFSKVLGK